MTAERIRVRGLVQGVGFRPTVWRLARARGLHGDVRNDGEGVLIRVRAEPDRIDAFCADLVRQCPPLARIDVIERTPAEDLPGEGFRIVASAAGAIHTGVVPDAATCDACRDEIFSASDRRYRYPFTNCTHCGPRLSIIRGIPYDRPNTSMDAFAMCPACLREYEDPADRRFHAQPNACPVCGPRVWLQNAAGEGIDPAQLGAADAVAAASVLLDRGAILAVKGIGGFHLACAADDARVVAELRRRKRRPRKPFALMARDCGVIRRYCTCSGQEQALLQSAAAPIVLLAAGGAQSVAEAVAPGQDTLGFMLPYSPLHHLLLEHWERPLVMTSGNLSEEPQCIDNRDASDRLDAVADYFLFHDRAIENRVDDSVCRITDGARRTLRLARGFAPASLALPEGFAGAPAVLALGGDLKNSFCLLGDGRALVSQHLGDLSEANTAREFERTLALYAELYQQRPALLAVDRHPHYRSSRYGRDRARRDALALATVQHHHAHVAAVLGENRWPLDGGAVLGIALDGLGFGDDGTVWGGEFLLADYRGFERLAHLLPLPLYGADKAALEPWRNAYAHIRRHPGWEVFCERYGNLPIARLLAGKPLALLDVMLERGVNVPLSSACGRWFDAVAAALGVCEERVSYEGQAAIELEVLARSNGKSAVPYPFSVSVVNGLPVLDPAPMWDALWRDLAAKAEPARVAASFHRGLIEAIAGLAERLCRERGIDTVALSGGVLQNRTLHEGLARRLRGKGLKVLDHKLVPPNDGGISLGQALVAAARHMG